MKIVFKKDNTKKYVCWLCDKQFNWNDNNKQSWVFGKLEYYYVAEQKNHEKHFCSTKCKNKFKKNRNNGKK